MNMFHCRTKVPMGVVIIAVIIMIVGYVFAYASRVVEIHKNQEVISTGLYSVVRHPMYFAGFES